MASDVVLLQNLIVSLVVVCSAGYAAWVLMPASWRRGLSAIMMKHPALAGSTRIAQHMEVKAGCGNGCNRCGAPARLQADASTDKPCGHSDSIKLHHIKIERRH